MVETGSALLTVFLGPGALQGLIKLSLDERMLSGPALKCQDDLRKMFLCLFLQRIWRG